MKLVFGGKPRIGKFWWWEFWWFGILVVENFGGWALWWLEMIWWDSGGSVIWWNPALGMLKIKEIL